MYMYFQSPQSKHLLEDLGHVLLIWGYDLHIMYLYKLSINSLQLISYIK